MAIMAVAIGFIFKDLPLFNIVRTSYSGIPIQKGPSNFLLAIYAVVPGIILHELFHKFVALSYGASAIFQANFMFLLIGVALKLLRFPFIIIAPAYVAIFASNGLAGHEMALIGFAGPFANLLLYLAAFAILKIDLKAFRSLKENPYWYTILVGTKYVNGILFLFNMLPIPGFDGHHIYRGLFMS
jgi:Zn-dependent protease